MPGTESARVRWRRTSLRKRRARTPGPRRSTLRSAAGTIPGPAPHAHAKQASATPVSATARGEPTTATAPCPTAWSTTSSTCRAARQAASTVTAGWSGASDWLKPCAVYTASRPRVARKLATGVHLHREMEKAALLRRSHAPGRRARGGGPKRAEYSRGSNERAWVSMQRQARSRGVCALPAACLPNSEATTATNTLVAANDMHKWKPAKKTKAHGRVSGRGWRSGPAASVAARSTGSQPRAVDTSKRVPSAPARVSKEKGGLAHTRGAATPALFTYTPTQAEREGALGSLQRSNELAKQPTPNAAKAKRSTAKKKTTCLARARERASALTTWRVPSWRLRSRRTRRLRSARATDASRAPTAPTRMRREAPTVTTSMRLYESRT
mmetsp:Transcript_13518/g.40825  ORF Transcript_13518/g.40825 Transcript_13518/m.40825 type:complete len:384 (-) Transcript_13518:579-1730(-)